MRIAIVCLVSAATTVLAGCGYTPEQRAVTGGGLGAGTGAVIASVAGASPGGVIASSILGGATGALIGANTRPPPPRPVYYVAPPPPGAKRCMVWGEDMYGRRFCDRYYYGS